MTLAQKKMAWLVGGGLAGGTVIGYAAAYYLARRRGMPGAVSLLHPAFAVYVDPGSTDSTCYAPQVYAGATPRTYDPAVAIAHTDPL